MVMMRYKKLAATEMTSAALSSGLRLASYTSISIVQGLESDTARSGLKVYGSMMSSSDVTIDANSKVTIQ